MNTLEMLKIDLSAIDAKIEKADKQIQSMQAEKDAKSGAYYRHNRELSQWKEERQELTEKRDQLVAKIEKAEKPEVTEDCEYVVNHYQLKTSKFDLLVKEIYDTSKPANRRFSYQVVVNKKFTMCINSQGITDVLEALKLQADSYSIYKPSYSKGAFNALVDIHTHCMGLNVYDSIVGYELTDICEELPNNTGQASNAFQNAADKAFKYNDKNQLNK